MPTISILMTAYNAEKYICKSIDSILTQTYSDFEFLILDDGSTDNTLKIINSYNDARIKVLLPGKIGYYAAKIKLIQEAKSDFIAIMDADDIATPDRLHLQLQFLKENNDYGLVGSRAEWIDNNGKLLNKEFPFVDTHEKIKCNLLFVNCFVHTSVMIRNSILINNQLNYKKMAGEDFDLWIRITQKTKAKNLNKVLISYRVHDSNMCHSDWYKLGEGISYLISDQLVSYFKTAILSNDIQTHLSLVEFSLKNKIEDLPHLKNWIAKLITLNKEYKHFDEQILQQVLYERILKKFLRLENYSYSVFQILMQLKKELQPTLTFELRKKELAILAFSLAKKKIIEL